MQSIFNIRALTNCLLLLLVAGTGTSLAQLGTDDIYISAGSGWKYLDDGSDQGTAWREPAFNDESWASGPAQLGFGDGDEATVLTSGYVTYYFRHDFTVTDPSAYPGLLLSLLRDDGAVVYLNGVEIQRSNMPSGDINYLTFASRMVAGIAEDTFYDFEMASDDLVTGENVMAVEVHQRRLKSSDVSFDLGLSSLDSIPSVFRKAPYLIFNGSNTEMQVHWQLDDTYGSTIDWGEDLNCTLGTQATSEYGQDHQHTHTISSLIPGTMYYYQVTAEGTTNTGSFGVAPDAGATSLKFLAYGDTRTYPADHNTVAGGMINTFAEGYQTVLISAGDLVFNGNSETDWDEQFFDPSYDNIQTMLSTLPYQACMGNHEGSGVLFQKYFPYPFIVGRYWSFDYGPAHFTVVDQYTAYDTGSPQLIWVENDLASTDKIWKFIVLHEPGWSAGGHGNNASVQNYIQPLCISYGVSILFAGHNHYYARALVNGVHHVTTGGGGAPLYTPNLGYPYIVTGTEVHHFCKIDINGNVLDFEAVEPDGTIIDSFTITPVENAYENSNSISSISLDIAPNPVQTLASVRFSVSLDSRVIIDLFDISGRMVYSLYDSETATGEHIIHFDADILETGIYFVRMNAGGTTEVERLVLLN